MNNFFYLWLFLCVFQCLNCYRIGGKCGFPGLPHETKIEPHKTIYEDGEKVIYSCPLDKIYVKTQVKTCISGQWSGGRSTCGYFIPNVLSNVKVIDLTTNLTVVDMNTTNYSSDEYPAAFFDEKGTGLIITDAGRPHKWWFEFSNTIVFDFFLLNIRTPKTKTHSRVAINEINSIQVKDVEVLNQENRTCAQDFSTRKDFAKIFWFECTQSTAQILNKSLTIIFTTYANQKVDSIGLHQVYFTKLQYCGHPPIPLLAKFNPQNEETEQIQCDSDISFDANQANSSELSELTVQEFLDCEDNQYWAGNPKCLPKNQCELNLNDSREEISSVKNAYILSQTEWYAIDGTTVYFTCIPGYQFIGNPARICINSTWDQPWPICGTKSSSKCYFIQLSIIYRTLFQF